MLNIADLSIEEELDAEVMNELGGGQYAQEGVTYGSGKTLMGALEEWAYYKWWY